MVTLEEILNRISIAIQNSGKKEIGNSIGVSLRQVNRYLDGSRGLNIETLLKISEATGIDICWFFGKSREDEVLNLAADEKKILLIYRDLNKEGKKYIMECAENASEVSRYKSNQKEALA
ncbi:helix-turn-helix transcriptional regulator [bacterium]|nr:helix-turn-helix transcriptional regulator [bacterium]